ncbi:MAG: hypothetical protein UY62_C0039G0031 [Parcubacteria group bacterium GW2011_GWF2_50_9]|nr:MAG: hypothetical protein UY62_C0039G0031 [Parcubacteria group bacterium GW2011_GWF2_50_9]
MKNDCGIISIIGIIITRYQGGDFARARVTPLFRI